MIDAIRTLRYSQEGQEPMHAHQQGQLIILACGVARVRAAHQLWALVPGQALWIPGGAVHELQAIVPLMTHNIYLTAEASRRFGSEFKGLQATPLLNELVEARLGGGDDPQRHELLSNLILSELQRLPALTLCHLTLPQDRRTRLLCDALCASPAHGETLAWWSKTVGASERTLARLFREETRMSFSEWRQQLRLVEAIFHLARGATIASLALDMGYKTPSAFIAMFKKRLGVSPQRYLRPTTQINSE